MLDSLLDGLKDQAGDALASKLGLSGLEIDNVVKSSKTAVEKTVTEGGQDDNALASMLNLFSDNDNDEKGNGLLEGLGGNLLSSLTSNGFSSDKASSIQSMVLPMIISAVTGVVKGDSANLGSLLSSGSLKDIAANLVKDKAAGFLKGLF